MPRSVVNDEPESDQENPLNSREVDNSEGNGGKTDDLGMVSRLCLKEITRTYGIVLQRA